MEYSCDNGQAQEIARLVLPLLSRLEIPMTPLNYALWYEYHLARSPELVEALSKIEAGHEPYDPEKARALFLRYVAGAGMATLQRVEMEVRRLLADILQIVVDAGLELTRYSGLLGSCSKRLENADDLQDIRRLVRTILDDTRTVADSNSEIASTLKDRAHEIDQLRAELERARQEAVKDPLTGLANRRAFDERLAESLDDTLAQLKNVCLMMIDVDHFKAINDRHGHQIGDKILHFVAAVLNKNTKGKDLVARFGGDEFAVIVENAPRAGVQHLAETIRQQVESSQLKRTDTGEPLGQLTVSIGYDCLRANDTPAKVLERADQALYDAKQAGRNRVAPYKG